jgi:pimeloyl-ACP methyl ester carboxylesterase
LGERCHLLTPQVGLDTHVQDIVGVLEYEDLENVVLVGHSYGGMVITGVAQKVAGRLAELVYLDAFLPENGKALKDYAPLMPTSDDGWRVPPPGPPQAFGVTDERDIAWMAPRLGDHPHRSFMEPVDMSANRTGSLRQTYIQCLKLPPFEEAVDRAKRQGFRICELFSGGHDTMITLPGELAKMLLDLVSAG